MDQISAFGMEAGGRVLVLGRRRSLLVRSFVLVLSGTGVTASTVDECDGPGDFDDVVSLLVCDDIGTRQVAPVMAAARSQRGDIVVVALDNVAFQGADVRLSSSADLDDLLRALRSGPAPPTIPAAPHRERGDVAGAARLTSREAQVAALLVEGERSVRIADELGISVHTVRTHVQNIMSKLGVNSRLEVAGVLAHNNGSLAGVSMRDAVR